MNLVDASLIADLTTLSRARVLFGHQSVGQDIIAGVRDLAQLAGLAGIRIVQLGADSLPDGPAFIHGFAGENGKPDAKCTDYKEWLQVLKATEPHVSLLKFCYADFNGDSNIDAIFDFYKHTVNTLQSAHPDVVLVHVTVPVTRRSAGWKRLARGLLGKTDPWDAASIKREAFNARLRSVFPSEMIFDLAGVESTRSDGRRTRFQYRGEIGYELIEDYTYDGGHLNEHGRRIVAREFVKFLATTIRGQSKLVTP